MKEIFQLPCRLYFELMAYLIVCVLPIEARATPVHHQKLTEQSFLFLWPGQSADDARLDLNSPIVTDRPDFTEASSTVGRGVSQIELGYTYFRDTAGGSSESSYVYPEALFRQGVFSDWFELRLGQSLITHDSAGDSSTDISNTYLGVKLGLVPQHSFLPEVSVVPQMTVPTGAGSNHILPGINLLYSWSLSAETYLGGSSQMSRVEENNNGDIFTTWSQATVVGSRFNESLGFYIEWFGIFEDSIADSGGAHFANGGLTLLYSKDIQYDIRFGTRLQDRFMEEIFAGVGVSIRFL